MVSFVFFGGTRVTIWRGHVPTGKTWSICLMHSRLFHISSWSLFSTHSCIHAPTCSSWRLSVIYTRLRSRSVGVIRYIDWSFVYLLLEGGSLLFHSRFGSLLHPCLLHFTCIWSCLDPATFFVTYFTHECSGQDMPQIHWGVQCERVGRRREDPATVTPKFEVALNQIRSHWVTCGKERRR